MKISMGGALLPRGIHLKLKKKIIRENKMKKILSLKM